MVKVFPTNQIPCTLKVILRLVYINCPHLTVCISIRKIMAPVYGSMAANFTSTDVNHSLQRKTESLERRLEEVSVNF